jgi:hypothetical protein
MGRPSSTNTLPVTILKTVDAELTALISKKYLPGFKEAVTVSVREREN